MQNNFGYRIIFERETKKKGERKTKREVDVERKLERVLIIIS